MANRKGSFAKGVVTVGDVTYHMSRNPDKTVHVMATSGDPRDPDGPMSMAHFEHDPDAGIFVVSPGTLDLHPDHKELGVGPQMGKLVNARYLRHAGN